MSSKWAYALGGHRRPLHLFSASQNSANAVSSKLSSSTLQTDRATSALKPTNKNLPGRRCLQRAADLQSLIAFTPTGMGSPRPRCVVWYHTCRTVLLLLWYMACHTIPQAGNVGSRSAQACKKTGCKTQTNPVVDLRIGLGLCLARAAKGLQRMPRAYSACICCA